MRRSILFLAVAFLVLLPAFAARPRAAAPAAPPDAPSLFDATHLGSPLQLDTGWRVGISADPAASQPAFDDSAWAIRNAADSIPEVAEPDDIPNHTGRQRGEDAMRRLSNPANHQLYAWFRLHIQLPPHHGPLALFVEMPISHNTAISMGDNGPSIDLYANGRLIHPEGPHGVAPDRYQQISRLYNLPVEPGETSLVLAVRILYLPFGTGAYTNFFSERKLFLGEPAPLTHALTVWSDNILFERLPRLIVSILLFLLGCFLLALYFGQKGHVEYLWLALHELAQVPIAFIDLAASTAHLDSVWYFASVAQLFLVSAWLYFEFLTAFLSLSRRRWYVRLLRYTAPVMILVGPAMLLLGRIHAIGLVLLATTIVSSFWILGWLIFVFFTLLRAALRRNFEAALLLVPLVLSFIGSLDPVFTAALTSFAGKPAVSPLTFEAGPIPIAFSIVADLAGILVIVIIVFLRFLRIQRDQERASSELAAARSVQELMIPQEKAATPGYEVDSVYSPASEVGGDFYHVQPTPDGGLLVVVGDVAGKGLTAAMNVSMLIGALRRSTEVSPAAILAGLNRVLAGPQCFTTCLAAFFGPQGELTLASAGHLSPYLNSQEVALPGGLPLGALPTCVWEEVRLFLHPGDRLLMISDGVVEARRSSGELFGFDRVHNLSNQSAFYIADAARDFGQEDDITVLTVRRLDTEA